MNLSENDTKRLHQQNVACICVHHNPHANSYPSHPNRGNGIQYGLRADLDHEGRSHPLHLWWELFHRQPVLSERWRFLRLPQSIAWKRPIWFGCFGWWVPHPKMFWTDSKVSGSHPFRISMSLWVWLPQDHNCGPGYHRLYIILYISQLSCEKVTSMFFKTVVCWSCHPMQSTGDVQLWWISFLEPV